MMLQLTGVTVTVKMFPSRHSEDETDAHTHNLVSSQRVKSTQATPREVWRRLGGRRHE